MLYFNLESESSEFEGSSTELWSSGEEEGLLGDLKEYESTPPSGVLLASETDESHALARWIFLSFKQHTSYRTLWYRCFSVFFSLFWATTVGLL